MNQTLSQVWIQNGDIVLVSLRDYQDDVADIVHKYYRGEARSLTALKEIPESVGYTYQLQRFGFRYTLHLICFSYSYTTMIYIP